MSVNPNEPISCKACLLPIRGGDESYIDPDVGGAYHCACLLGFYRSRVEHEDSRYRVKELEAAVIKLGGELANTIVERDQIAADRNRAWLEKEANAYECKAQVERAEQARETMKASLEDRCGELNSLYPRLAANEKAIFGLLAAWGDWYDGAALSPSLLMAIDVVRKVVRGDWRVCPECGRQSAIDHGSVFCQQYPYCRERATLLTAAKARVKVGHNDTCNKEFDTKYDCTCGHDLLATALTGLK